MKVLTRHVAKEVLIATLFVLVALVALIAFFDLVSQARNIGNRYSISMALFLTMLKLPSRLYEVMPIAALLGAVYTMSRLASNSEFTIMRVAGLSPFRLAGVHGDDAAPDGLGHICARVDGDHDEGGQPDARVALEGRKPIDEIGQAVVEEHRLKHHRGAPEDFHVNADHGPDQGQKEPFDRRVILGMGDGVEHTADKADDTADQRGHQRQNQSVADAGQIVGSAVFGPELDNIGSQLGKFLHGNRLPSVNKS